MKDLKMLLDFKGSQRCSAVWTVVVATLLQDNIDYLKESKDFDIMDRSTWTCFKLRAQAHKNIAKFSKDLENFAMDISVCESIIEEIC